MRLRIVIVDDEPLDIDGLVKYAEVVGYLDSRLFLRVHKSYLVALSRIDTVENGLLVIQGHEIAVSRPLREQVLDLVVKGRLLGK